MNADLIKDLAAKVLAQETSKLTLLRITEVVNQFLVMAPDLLPLRDTIIEDLRANFSVSQDTYQVLKDDEYEREAPWLKQRRATGTLTWQFWHRYRLYLERKMAMPTVNEIDRQTDDILDLLPDPTKSGAWNRRGMVVGQVQSGKTGNYIGVINKAADAGYKLIIVLAGMHDSLRAQTQDRVDKGFLGYDTAKNLDFTKANNIIGVGAYSFNSSFGANALTTSELDGDFKKPVAKSAGHNIKIGPPIVLVIKKNPSILRNLILWLAKWGDTQEDKKKLICAVPMLLIDDEADNASVNVSKEYISTINGLIRSLLSLFEQSAYVGYTATPFANIFIQTLEESVAKGLNTRITGFEFTVGQDLFPRDFIINIPAPSNYIGPAKIFGLSAAAGSEDAEEAMPVVINLSDSNGFNDDYATYIPNNHKPGDPRPKALPPSLIYAIKCFVLTCAARRVRNQHGEHNSMLIHVSRFVRWQDEVAALVDEAFQALRNRIDFNQEDTWDELAHIWQHEYKPVTAQLLIMSNQNPTAYQDPAIRPLTWVEVRPEVLAAVSLIEVRAVHGDKKQAGLRHKNISPLDYTAVEKLTPPQHLSIIAIGGDKLSRGLTLEGLSVSYYLRATKMYDTLMQMGRWFGYRPGYADLCRLFTTAELISWHEHITIASEEVRREFDRMYLLGRSPRQFGLKVRTHPGVLKITSINKFRGARTMELSYSAELEQTYRLQIDETVFTQNLEALTYLLAQADALIVPPNTKSAARSNLVWKTDSQSVCQFLSEYQIDKEVVDMARVISYIEKQAVKRKLTDWTVAVINNTKATSTHTLMLNGQSHVIGLTTRSNAARDWPEFYHISKSQLISPEDEYIDLNQTQFDKADEQTKEDWHKTKPDSNPSYPSTFRIKYNRPETKGLLLVYLLNPVVKVSTTKKEQVLATVPIVGLAISFPNIEHDEKIEYAVNEQYRPELGSDDDFDE